MAKTTEAEKLSSVPSLPHFLPGKHHGDPDDILKSQEPQKFGPRAHLVEDVYTPEN